MVLEKVRSVCRPIKTYYVYILFMNVYFNRPILTFYNLHPSMTVKCEVIYQT